MSVARSFLRQYYLDQVRGYHLSPNYRAPLSLHSVSRCKGNDKKAKNQTKTTFCLVFRTNDPSVDPIQIPCTISTEALYY